MKGDGCDTFANAMTEALVMKIQSASDEQSWNVTHYLSQQSAERHLFFLRIIRSAILSCIEKGHISTDDPQKLS